MNPDVKKIITGGGAVAGAFTGLAVGSIRNSEDKRAYVMVGGLAGGWLANAACHYLDHKARTIEAIAELIIDEGNRQGKPLDKSHIESALKRFDKAQLKLFDQYVRAFIARDSVRLNTILPQWRKQMQPVISNSPEWLRYEGIIFGS